MTEIRKSAAGSTVVHQLAAQIRRDIALGILEPNSRLNIEGLKRERKVSHPSIREALALLAGEGYVQAEGNKGYRVLASSLEELRDTTRLRAELECLGFRWSMERSDADWRASVVACHHTLSEVEADMGSDPRAFAVEWDDRNRQFHFALIGNCGSPRLIDTVATLYDLTRRYRLMAYAQNTSSRPDWLVRSPREHGALKDFALKGDVAAGEAALRAHITKSFAEPDLAVLSFPGSSAKTTSAG
ncbi:GntR family transcriptional regulator [Vannielia litorea]|uniref:Transcriptional regulator, GntR family n=1 Tax=Vannielia litorea TaxID=1217970 RepID=A0A1N6FXH5_9RHOB|nr:GntR family transcriptional regulator [Vannielia litorea]SIN99891.1 transcriptional regulator, GntR family [Vannielia litorea]